MRIRLLLSLGISSVLIPLGLHAQLNCPPVGKINFNRKINVTLGVGPTLLYGDIVRGKNVGIAGVLKGDYKLYKGLYAGVEAQLGILNAYGRNYDQVDIPVDYEQRDPRFVKNYYYSGSLNLTIFPGLFFVDERQEFRKPALGTLVGRGLYVGFGVGGVVNNYDKLYRNINSNASQAEFEYDANGDIVKYKTPTRDILWPIGNLGLFMPLNKYSSYDGRYLSLVVNTQFNFAKDDQLDAYRPFLGEGRRSKGDVYNFTYVGLSYTF
ncbi:hypothetical protein [Sphingobacterium griseoflavum]|uniref:Outer membrane protein beta-barrel domain-containing protein n=1 Tax=Sphingobacterium griseoflavum TaxID=1474952 RepID=A0ABQ3I1P3_9SPHI|nr:hypothetical protein [Sphingobacterium griseoflavum]GHE41727.1 hypothetical protein GCM10017764_26150 [Sphingobacterium griseoflavum]